MPGLGTALAETARRRGHAVALIYDSRAYTYADLDNASAAFADALRANGITAGDHVAVGFTNSPRLVIAVLGVLRAGAVLIPLNPAYTAEELVYVGQDAKLAAAFVENSSAEALRRANLPRLQVWDDLPRGGDAYPPAATMDPTTAAVIIYTSGTTGRPKGAVLSHAALQTNLAAVATAWGWTEQDRLLLTLPCFHLHGLGLGILNSFLVGSSVVLRQRFQAAEIFADLADNHCTMFFAVPTMYSRLLALPAGTERQHDLQRMRLWVSGSAPLNAALHEAFERRFNYSLMDRYGMTECGFVLSTNCHEPRRAGVVGRPLPGVDVRLIDPDAAAHGDFVAVADGEAGEIAIRGANLFNGYWQRPDETARAFLAGYLRSGDIALREPDGQYRVIGRLSVDIIKTRGFKVGAVEIEEVLQRHPGIQEVAVVGIPDADQGQKVVAVYVPVAAAQFAPHELRDHCRRFLAPHKVPTEFVEIDEIPRIGPGKFKKSELIARLSGSPTVPKS